MATPESYKNQVSSQEALEPNKPEVVEQQPQEPQPEASEEVKIPTEEVDEPVIPTIDVENEAEEEKPEESKEKEFKPKPSIDDIVTDLAQIVVTKGELSEEELKQFEEKGYSKNEVELAFKGLKADYYQKTKEVYDAIGGKEVVNEVISWANKHLPKTERQEVANLLSSGDLKVMKWVMMGLKSVYDSQNPDSGFVTGTASKTPDRIEPFASREEMFKALTDPRLGQDPQLRELVYARAKITK